MRKSAVEKVTGMKLSETELSSLFASYLNPANVRIFLTEEEIENNKKGPATKIDDGRSLQPKYHMEFEKPVVE